MQRNFKDKVVVITGAAGSLGTELCLAFGMARAKIVALDIHPKCLYGLSSLLRQKDIEAMILLCDITDQEACRSTFSKAIQHFHRIDILINNAGITHIGAFHQEGNAIQLTRKVMEVNFFGAIQCTKVVLPHIIRNKCMIITISSVAGFAPLVNRTAYAASKHALQGFFNSLRTELNETGVKIMTVCPSFVDCSNHVKNIDKENDQCSIHQSKKTIGQMIAPNQLAKRILHAAFHKKKLLVVGRTGHIAYFAFRFFPRLYDWVMVRRFKIMRT